QCTLTHMPETPHPRRAVPLPRHAALRILAARRGSSWPVVVQTPAGQFLTKLRGAAQGTAPLIAEVIVAEIATLLGLPVPDRALVTLEDDVPSDDERDELLDLLRASRGENLGFRLLAGATDLRADQVGLVSSDVATRIVWLDGLVMNPDRTAMSPNILLWHRQPWLIDHGAALSFHYDWSNVTEDSPRSSGHLERQHLLGERVERMAEVDAQCAGILSRDNLTTSVARVPRTFLTSTFPRDDPDRIREAYVAFLWKRLKAPRPFLPDAP
ncbi:MAG TPA: HipA family kinase, partial [Polyangiaceae bacterium]